MIIYLPAPVFLASVNQARHVFRKTGAGRDELYSTVIDRRYSSAACDDTRGSTPKVFGVYGPAVLSLFCLAPHGVFLASRITPRAVSSYLAFSPLPAPRRGKLTASPTLPKNRRCLFCDTL